jgi:hypothetical protein
MAITAGNSDKFWNGSAVASFTRSFDAGSGANGLLVVSMYWSSSRTVSAITYDGVAMTQVVAPVNTGGGEQIGMWYLTNPASGSNTLSVTFSGTTAYEVSFFSMYGVDQSSPLGATRTETGLETGTSYSEALTTTINDSWIIWATREYAGRTVSAGADTTLLERHTVVFGQIQARSTGGAAAGSRTLTLTANLSGNWFSDILAEFKPATAAPASSGFFAFF